MERIKKKCLQCAGLDSSLSKKRGGGGCCSWEPILSLWSDCLLDRERRRQQSSNGRPAAATRRDLSSASSSAVFPYYSQRLNCRETHKQQSSSWATVGKTEGGEKKKKLYLLALFLRYLSSLQGTNCSQFVFISSNTCQSNLERLHRK